MILHADMRAHMHVYMNHTCWRMPNSSIDMHVHMHVHGFMSSAHQIYIYEYTYGVCVCARARARTRNRPLEISDVQLHSFHLRACERVRVRPRACKQDVRARTRQAACHTSDHALR